MADDPRRSAERQDQPESPTFEQAYAELEQTVSALQQGQLSLDETLRLYERGSFLARCCLQKLDGAELKVSQLLARADGSLSTRPIASERDVVPPALRPDQPPEGEDLAFNAQKELFD